MNVELKMSDEPDFKYWISAYYPFASREQRDELTRHYAADERQQRYAGNGQGYGYQRFGLVAIYEDGGDVTEEEEMHQVHTERKLRQLRNPTRGHRLLDATEEQEGSEGGAQHVRGAELPRPLQHRRLDGLAWYTGIPERPAGEGRSYQETQPTDTQTFGATPIHVHTDVVSQHQVAQIARAVVEHTEIGIPEAVTPQISADKPHQPRHTGGEHKDGEEELFILGRCLLNPR